MLFINSELEKQVRLTLGLQTTDKMTEADLQKIIGIHVDYNLNNDVHVPWSSDVQAFQMKMPNLFITENMLNDEDMKLFPHITTFHSVVRSLTIKFLPAFPNLTGLYLYSAIIDDWSFLSKLYNLNKIYIRKCGDKGNKIVKMIADIRIGQDMGIVPHGPVIDDVLLNYLNITDISPMRGIRTWTELNLSHNEIADVSPLTNSKVRYLRFKYNKLSDISPLENCGACLLNLRHNEVCDITPIIKNKEMNPMLKHLYIGHNPIPAAAIQQLRGYRWIESDFHAKP
jgi:hypothetical protein